METLKKFMNGCADAAGWVGKKASDFPLRIEMHHDTRPNTTSGTLIVEAIKWGTVAAIGALGFFAFGPASTVGIVLMAVSGTLGAISLYDDIGGLKDRMERRTIQRMKRLKEDAGLSEEQVLDLCHSSAEKDKTTSPVHNARTALAEPIEARREGAKESWASRILGEPEHTAEKAR